MSSNTKATGKRLLRPRNAMLALLVICIASVAVVRSRRQDQEDETESKDRYFVSVRGNFNIAVVLDGDLDAIKRHELSYQGRGLHGLEVAEVVEDKAAVKAGDMVVRFSREKYDEAIDNSLLRIEGAQMNLMMAEQDLQMTKVAGQNTIKFSTDTLRASELALRKHEYEDAPRKRRQLTAAIASSETALQEANDALSEARDALSTAKSQGDMDISQLAKQIITREKAAVAAGSGREKAMYSLRVFKKYEHPDKLRTLNEATTKNRMQLRQDIVQASGNEVKARRTIQSYKANLEQSQEQLVNLREDIELLALTAPIAGMVSLGAPQSGRHYRNQQKEIKIGAEVSRREIVATIPDLSKFSVHVNVPEEFRSHIKLDQSAKLRSKAIPELMLSGKVTSISPVATAMIRWDPNSPKYYASEISTDGADPRLMPGMTMNAEILVDVVKDVIYVPIEAVYNREGKKWCQVRKLTGLVETEVTTGRSSNDYVEILTGLDKGDEVFLHRE